MHIKIVKINKNKLAFIKLIAKLLQLGGKAFLLNFIMKMCFWVQFAGVVAVDVVDIVDIVVFWSFESEFDWAVIFYLSVIFRFLEFPLFSLVLNFLFHSNFLQLPCDPICSPMKKAHLTYSQLQNFTQITQAHLSVSYISLYMIQHSSCRLPINYDSSLIFY